MIRIFSPTDTDFTTNGDVIVKATRATIHKQDNGDFYLEIEAPVGYVSFFQPMNIIVCDTPQGAQAFRLGKDIKTTQTRIKAKALHVFYDSTNYITTASIAQQTCKEALDDLNEACDSPSPFTMASDILTDKSYDCENVPLSQAVLDLVPVYGGHLVRDNFNIAINSTIGQDLGVTIQYKKNLKNIEKTENWDSVCTKVYPIGKDGYTIGFVQGPVQYDIPFTKVVEFEQDINEDDYDDEDDYYAALADDLLEQAQAYLKEAYKPSINYTLSANVEKITDVGDIVSVQDEELGISLIAKVISFEFDAILGEYTTIQFGTVAPGLSDLVKTVNNTVNKAVQSSSQNLTDYVNQEFDVLKNYVDMQDTALLSSISKYLYFKANESISLSKEVCSGWIDSTSKIISFTLPLHKDTDGKEASISVLKVNGFSINGAIWTYSANGKDIIADSSLSVSCTTQKNSITVKVTSSTALSVDASTPVTIEVESITVTFN